MHRCIVAVHLLMVACSASTGSEGEGESAEGEGESSEGEGEGGEGGEGEGEGESITNPWGFPMRAPQLRQLACDTTDPSCSTGTIEFVDEDVVCTFTVDGRDDVVYLQATPTAELQSGGLALTPIFAARAFLFSNDVVTEMSDASYDYGGGHHNDFYRFSVDGESFTYNHSSYGFGFRACQPVDCVQREGGAADIDGCRPERTLPEACIAVASPLPELVDAYARCAGDDP